MMTANKYQVLASRTVNLEKSDMEIHALHGMASELGEIHSIYQHTFQGEQLNKLHVQKELGDLLWFIAEYCTSQEWSLESIMQMNIDKLQKRYPNGFEAKKSIERKEEL